MRDAELHWPDTFQWVYRKPKSEWGIPRKVLRERKRQAALAESSLAADIRDISK